MPEIKNLNNDAELELLRAEIEYLQSELASRDAEYNGDDGTVGERLAVENFGEQEVERLVVRLEELLEELRQADVRAHTMDDLLRAAEEANHAEQEERRQIENWLGEIEQRVNRREEEMQVQLEQLRERLAASTEERARAERKIRELVEAEAAQESSNQQQSAEALKLAELLRQQQFELESSHRERTELQQQLTQLQQQDNTHELRELEQKLARMELETSRERAEVARQRAEFEAVKEEFERRYQPKAETGDSDSRIVAMRQHLREIHELEKQQAEERRQNSLGGRIAKLLNRV